MNLPRSLGELVSRATLTGMVVALGEQLRNEPVDVRRKTLRILAELAEVPADRGMEGRDNADIELIKQVHALLPKTVQAA